ncbi:DUF5134 domain-containing protein, partial [Jiangella rhizosphaerae]|uniref:DUF5134 domain-containing protein n=1 Tax=Jiangella rhizosphaerae TaxID=2293569 RepID=UPI001313FBE0
MTRRAPGAGVLAADVPDLSHALMGLAMALMVSPAGPSVPEPLGIATFAVLAAWFAARLRHDGVLSRAALPGLPGPAERASGAVRLGDLGRRDRGTAGHGGYHLHHLAGCAAMVVMYLTGPGPAGAGAPTALGTHGAVPPLAALCWVLGLYFLVAATSLGFRVGEPAVQLNQHAATAATGRFSPAAGPAPAPAA